MSAYAFSTQDVWTMKLQSSSYFCFSWGRTKWQDIMHKAIFTSYGFQNGILLAYYSKKAKRIYLEI